MGNPMRLRLLSTGRLAAHLLLVLLPMHWLLGHHLYRCCGRMMLH
jgi:hypothetical protein